MLAAAVRDVKASRPAIAPANVVERIACMAHFLGVIVNEHDFVALLHKHLCQLHAGESGAYYEYGHVRCP